MAQDNRQPLPIETEPGCDAVQVSGILLSAITLVAFGRELFPITSVTVATTV
jgi:hypothetical protein